MKNLFLIIIAIFAAIAFTGCGAKNISYDKYSIEKNLNKDIDKISNQNINIIDLSDEIIVKKLGNKSYSLRSFWQNNCRLYLLLNIDKPRIYHHDPSHP